MAKLGSWDTTAANNNSAPPDGWPEGQAPSSVNNCAREMMASIATVFQDPQFFDKNLTPTFINTTNFSVVGNQTSAIHAGRRLKIFDATAGVATTIYATVVTASFTTVTTITIAADAGQLTSSLSSFAVSILSNTNAIPASLSVSSIATDNLTVAGTLSVSGATVLKGALSVGGAINTSGNIDGNGTLNISGSAIINNVSIAAGIISISSTAAIAGLRLNISSGVVNGNQWLIRSGGSGNIFIVGAADDTGSLGEFVSFVRSATTILNVSIPGDLTVSGALTCKTTLSVGGAAVLGTTLTVSGATSLLTTLSVSGATVLKGALSVGGAVDIAGAAGVAGAFSVGTTTVLTGATTMGSTLTVSGALTCKTTLSVGGATIFTGAGRFDSTLTVSGAVNCKTTLSVSGASIFTGAVRIDSTLTVSADTKLLTTLTVLGATTLGSTLSVSGATVLSGALSVGGNTSIAGTLSASAITAPLLLAKMATSQTFAPSVQTRINFNEVIFDTHSFYRSASAVYAPTKPGKYLVCAQINMVHTAVGATTLELITLRDGSAANAIQSRLNREVDSGANGIDMSVIVDVTAGQEITIAANITGHTGISSVVRSYVSIAYLGA